MLTPAKADQIYASVLADGKIHVTVPEGTEGSVVRKYKTSDGTEGTKTELVYSELIGKITNVEFREGNFGRTIQVTVIDGEEKPVVLSMSTSSNYAEDLMKKIINVDLEKPVKISPYSFVDDKKKSKKGITIFQGDKKLTNYFYDSEKKKNINGYPEPKKLKKPLSKDQWKLYFAEAREFLVEQVSKHFNITEPVEATDDAFAGFE